MISILRQRNFALLWFGGLISFTGDWVLFTALPLFIFNLTGSVLATGLVFIVNSVPSIIFGTVAGVYVDRWDRRQVLIVANLLRGLILVALLFVDSPDKVWIVYVAGFLGRSLNEFLMPAEHALLPKLVGEQQLVKANALNSLNNNLARLIGPAVGGLAVTLWGFASAVLIDAASFVVAGLMIWLIAAPKSVTRAQHEDEDEGAAGSEPRKPNVLREWKEGLAMVARNRIVSALFVLLGVSALAEGFIAVFYAIFVQTSLGGSQLEFGWFLTAQAAGGLVGGMFIGRMSDRFTPRQMVGWGFLILGVFDVLIFTSSNLVVALTLMFIVGIPVVGLSTGAMTLFQTSVPDRFRGRVIGAYGTTQALIMLLAMGFASLFGSGIGAVPMLATAGIFYALAGVAAFALLPKAASQEEPAPARHSIVAPEIRPQTD